MVTFSELTLEIYGDVSATCSFGKQDDVKRYPSSRVSLCIAIQVVTEKKTKWFMISAVRYCPSVIRRRRCYTNG